MFRLKTTRVNLGKILSPGRSLLCLLILLSIGTTATSQSKFPVKMTVNDSLAVCFTEWQAKRIMLDLGELGLLREQNSELRTDVIQGQSDLFKAGLVQEKLESDIKGLKKKNRKLIWICGGSALASVFTGFVVGLLL